MAAGKRLTVSELAALRAEIQRGAGDWNVTLQSIDGIPAGQYVPVPDEENHGTA